MSELQDAQALADSVQKLRIAYELYFAGAERFEPLKERDRVKKELRRLMSVRSNNTAYKFKLQSTQATLVTYENHWDRIVRQIEEGTFKRDKLKAQKHLAAMKDVTDDVELIEDAEPVTDLSRELADMDTGEALASLMPMDESRVPMADGRAPMADGRKPMADGRKPMADGRAPMADSRVPMADSRAPMADGRAPMADSRKPMADGRAPMADGRKPMADSRAPMADGRKPMADSRAPMADSRAPMADGRAPSADSRKPSPEPRAPAAAPPKPAEDPIRHLHAAFTAARAQTGETKPVSVEALAETIRKQTAAVKAQLGVERVEFRVAIKDGKAVLKAIPK